MKSQSKNIHPDLIQIALEKVEGFAFEKFAQDFLSVLEGRNFVPVGGIKDGGADGLFECENGRTYYQFTRQENHRDKIRKTVLRLIEFGRTVKILYYLSSRVIPHIDKEEDLLSDELNIIVKIRDRKYISSHINDSIGTIASYDNHLAVYTQFLENIARSDNSFTSSHVKDPSAFVFLQHEVANRLGNRKLVHSLTDSMILWSLSETDPDKKLFMSEDQIREKIFNSFPWAQKLMKGHIRQRLEKLRTKDEAGREVRWYQKEKKYCLPYELNIIVKIRDRKYISSHINDSIGTIASYDNHLAVYTQFLENIARSDNSFTSSHVKDPSAFVFLQHEVANRLGNRKLVHSLTDSMILWSLSETDPDKKLFMSEDQIREKIFNSFPWAQKLMKGHIRQRLEKLRTKDEAGREVRWYQKEKKYCLPYETRSVIKNENKSDECLKINFIEEIKLISADLFDSDDGEYQHIAELCNEVVHSVFEKQGLLFAHFLTDDDENNAPPIVSDCIDKTIEKAGYTGRIAVNYREYMETIIRQVFYHSSPSQREYLTNLSRTYVLLFTLQAEPRIIEYFSTMAASFRLFLGSDILVKALSERYLAKEDQVARNLLKMASASGIKMYLSECVLEEIYQHIKGTYYEFFNYFSQMEDYITREIASNSRKILIRSYFYAKEEQQIKSWRLYLGQFITYNNIEKPEGREELRKYLLAEYNLQFVENSELENTCNVHSVETLADSMLDCDDKQNAALAYNTALLVHGIYGLRTKYKETSSASELGFKTWWMTNQTRVLRHTSELIKDKRAQYIMRPEYILNFIALSPNCSQVRDNFSTIFPSVFGIQLGHWLRDDIFHNIMNDVREWKDYEPGRITALMSDLSDRLKSDRFKRYEHNLSVE